MFQVKAGREGFEPPTAGLRVRFREEAVAEESFDFKEFYEEFKDEFEAWVKRKVSEDTAETYLKALERHLPRGIREPKDFDKIVTKSKYVSNGVRNFLNFLEDQYYMDSLGGFGFSIWRKHLPVKTPNKKNNKVFLTNDHIREALELIEEKWKDPNTTRVYKLLVYSGLRMNHALTMLSDFDSSKLIIERNVAMYPLDSFGEGNKRAYLAFMPEDFARELEGIEIKLSFGTFKSRLNPTTWKPPVNNPVTPVRIRAWFQNFAIENGVITEAVRFIVGHSPATIGEAHYYNLRKLARDEYRKLVDKFPI